MSISLEECKEKCMDITQCIGVDYTNTDKYETISSCRLYTYNTFRVDPGVDNRKYCENAQ